MIYFIDFENVHLNGLKGIETLSAKDTVVILYSYSQKSLLIKFVSECTTDATIQFHCVSVGYKDALDMKLVLKAMLMYKAGNSSLAFISKDHIFTGIRDALREFNYLGRITLAVGTACDSLYRYYCFEYGTLRVYERVSDVYLSSDNEFIPAASETFRLVNTIEIQPDANIRVCGIHTADERKELWRRLEAVEEPKCGQELSGVIARDTKALAVTPIKPLYGLTDNIKRDNDWHSVVFDFCFNFLYAEREHFKIFDSRTQTTLLRTFKAIVPKDRCIEAMLKATPSHVGCKEQQLRDLYNVYVTKVRVDGK